jgi:stage II sporulation protein AA (anti-sigma F factor antagonist)
MDYKKDALLIRLAGDFDLVSARNFRETADQALDELCPRHIILDLTQLSFLDSSGIGAILGRLRKLQARQGRMVLAGACPSVRRVLELSGIMPLVGICATMDQAWALLAQQKKEA